MKLVLLINLRFANEIGALYESAVANEIGVLDESAFCQ